MNVTGVPENEEFTITSTNPTEIQGGLLVHQGEHRNPRDHDHAIEKIGKEDQIPNHTEVGQRVLRQGLHAIGVQDSPEDQSRQAEVVNQELGTMTINLDQVKEGPPVPFIVEIPCLKCMEILVLHP